MSNDELRPGTVTRGRHGGPAGRGAMVGRGGIAAGGHVGTDDSTCPVWGAVCCSLGGDMPAQSVMKTLVCCVTGLARDIAAGEYAVNGENPPAMAGGGERGAGFEYRNRRKDGGQCRAWVRGGQEERRRFVVARDINSGAR